jgi:hypothetical protein
MRLDAADRRYAPDQRVVGRGLEADRAGLRHSISDGDLAHVHPVDDLTHDGLGTDCSGHDAGAKRAEVETFAIELLQLCDEHGGDAVKGRTALLFDGLQDRAGFESIAGKDHGCPVRQAAHVPHHHSEAMVEWNRNAQAIRFGEVHRRSHEEAVVEDVVVRKGRALGRAGRAAGELDVDRIVLVQRSGSPSQCIDVSRPRGDIVEAEPAGAIRTTDLDRNLEAWEPFGTKVAGGGGG